MIPRYLVNFSAQKIEKKQTDILIIGSGIAGLGVALNCEKDLSVTIITKTELAQTATRYAQGGIAVSLSHDDSPQYHYEDTILTGAKLCKPKAVEILVNEGPERIKELIEMGTHFDKKNGEISLTREGGHSRARIIHAGGDATGRIIEKRLTEINRKLRNIAIYEDIFVLDLITDNNSCYGALVMDIPKNKIYFSQAKVVVLSTGGCGQIYMLTTNPAPSTGDGLAMAYRAGAEMADLEFVQFHPTALYTDEEPKFLITEALRGEGAYIRDIQDHRIMEGIHPLKEIAPRDVVVKRMIEVMNQTRVDHLFLDARHLSRPYLQNRFPTVYLKCLEYGWDLKENLIPVMPAAHYMNGGIRTDLNGMTNIKNLYACGEVACTGVHGANRLASNSLLEALVFSKRIAEKLKKTLGAKKTAKQISPSYSYPRIERKINWSGEEQLLKKLMMENIGPLRNKTSLIKMKTYLDKKSDLLKISTEQKNGFEVQNMIITANLITTSALMREESRGSHQREDFPEENENLIKRILLKLNNEPKFIEIEE